MLAAGLALALAPSLAPAVEPALGSVAASSGDGSAGKVPVVVATYNVRTDTPHEPAEAAVRRLTGHADVAGLQEFENRRRLPILDGLADLGWDYYKPQYADPVIWNTEEFAFLSGRVVTVAAAAVVEEPKDDYALTEKRDSLVTVVRLWHRDSQRRMVFLNAHLIARSNVDGRPNPLAPRRSAFYRQEMTSIRALTVAEGKHGRVFPLGDWNVHYPADERQRVKTFPFRRFTSIGYVSMWDRTRPSVGTFPPNGIIDGVWATKAPARARVLTGFTELAASDHIPAVATYRVAPTGRQAPAATAPPAGEETGPTEPGPTEPGDGGCLLLVLC